MWTFTYCPIAPPWRIDWDLILDTFPAIRALSDCPQDDVFTHTKLVCEALVNNPDWQNRSPVTRSIVFAAALFHDIAKASTTEIDEDGLIHARGHGRKSGAMVRPILQDLNTPFTLREQIISIVELSSLPLWFWERENPQRSVIFASQMVNCNLLALMATAEVGGGGRSYHDPQQQLDRIELFSDFCRELDCFDRPFPFPSALSRFIYFSKENGDPYYHAYDDTEFEVILTCGIPGTGKDYWIAHHHPDRAVISLDDIRAELKISPTADQGSVMQRAKDLARQYLQAKVPFIWNATNIIRSNRSGLIRSFASYRASVKIIYLEVPYPRVIAQNRSRDRQVPIDVIDRFRRRMEIPHITEAPTVEWLVDY
jgi:predicted kinase